MDEQLEPKIFANKVIQQLMDHLFGGTISLQKKDFELMRLAFTQMGGVWQGLFEGRIEDFEKLMKIVEAFGSSERATKKVKVFI